MDQLPGWWTPTREQVMAFLTLRRRRWYEIGHSARERRRRQLATIIEEPNLWFAMSLVELAASDDAELAALAAGAVQNLLQRLPLASLPIFDERCRRRGWYVEALDHRPFKLVRRLGDSSLPSLCVASCHPSGWIREAAVRSLARHPRSAFPWLLLRADDWVQPVRMRALQAVLAALDAGGPQLALQYLPLVLQLRKRARFSQAPISQRVETLLRLPEARQGLLEAVGNEDSVTRSTAARILVETAGAEIESLLPVLATSRSPLVRLTFARGCRRRLDKDTVAIAFPLLSHDPFPPVRVEMLQALAESAGDSAREALQRSLLDPSAWVRGTARLFLQRLTPEPIDLADLYRRNLTQPLATGLVAAILGLGETGTDQDAGRLEPFLGHQSLRVRRAAIRSLARLSPERHAQQFRLLVLDPSPGVSREASSAIRRRPGSLDAADLWRLIESAQHAHGRRNLLRLVAVLPKWDQLECLLRAALSKDQEEREFADAGLRRWTHDYNRSFVEAPREQLERIRVLLASLGTGLDRRLRMLLELQTSS